MDNRPIGVFDSGVGGLTVVKQIIKTMPYEHTLAIQQEFLMVQNLKKL